MARRSCANCCVEWPRYRWCDDCLRMVAKTVIAEISAAIGVVLATWLLHRLF
jgi:hypothetical protein